MYTAVEPKMPNTSAACISNSNPENATASIAGRKRRHSWISVLRASGIMASASRRAHFLELPFALSVARAASGVEVHPSTSALRAYAQGERISSGSWLRRHVRRRIVRRQRRAAQRLVQRDIRKSVRKARLLAIEFGFGERELRVSQLQAIGLAQASQFFAQRQTVPRSRRRRLRTLHVLARSMQCGEIGFDFRCTLQYRLSISEHRRLQLVFARITHRAALAPVEQRD